MSDQSRLPKPSPRSRAHLLLCDACCDNSGALKEMIKTGGCTCDICGWACKCCGDDGKQFINRVLIRAIPEAGWPYLHKRNERSLRPLNWEKLFTGERDSEL